MGRESGSGQAKARHLESTVGTIALVGNPYWISIRTMGYLNREKIYIYIYNYIHILSYRFFITIFFPSLIL